MIIQMPQTTSYGNLGLLFNVSFSRQPFTQMRSELTEQASMNVDFSYIPEWDSWPGLFMRGVRESREEASNPELCKTWGIDYEVWKERRARGAHEPYQK